MSSIFLNNQAEVKKPTVLRVDGCQEKLCCWTAKKDFLDYEVANTEWQRV